MREACEGAWGARARGTGGHVMRGSTYNLGQRIVDKFTKLSQIGFSNMKCSTVNILLFFTEKRQRLVFGWPAGYLLSGPSISGILVIFLKSYVVQQLVRQLVHSHPGDNNLVPFHLC